MESPPYRGASAPQQPFGRTNGAGGSPLFIAPPSRGLMLAPSRYDGIVPAQTPSLMSLTVVKSRVWSDGAAGSCSACRHRRSTSHGELPAPSRVVSQRLDLTVQERRISHTVEDAQTKFIRMKSASKKRTPSIVNLTVKRRYLTEREVERLMDCARKYGRYGHRDATMILVAYRHGLRASEVCDLQGQQTELSEGRLHVHRVKNGIPSVHPIRGDEMRALRKLRREYPKDAYVFVSERGGPISPIGFHRLIQRLGEVA